MASDSRQLAVLIDGDSVDMGSLGRIVVEAYRHGNVAIGRVYGDCEKLFP